MIKSVFLQIIMDMKDEIKTQKVLNVIEYVKDVLTEER
jgi:hypothetical protein